MNWQKKNYTIKLSDGTDKFYSGISNGLFALSFGCTLTHLRSGYAVAQFRDEESGKRVGDYLADTYAAEFAALNKAIKKGMTGEKYKALPEAQDLNRKMKSDAYFQAQISEFAVKQKELNNDND